MSHSHRNDLLALALLIALSLSLDRHTLGFYGDDWGFLRDFSFAADQSVAGLFRKMYAAPPVRMRPGQVLYDALLYRAFGPHPFGYHLVNATVLVAVGLLLYTVLRRLGLQRTLSVAVALLYSLLPHYSTDRVWMAAAQAPLSMVFYLVSLYAAIAALRGERWRSAGWQVVNVLSLLASGLCYEVTIPLFLLHPLLVGWAARAPGTAVASPAGPSPESQRLLRRRWMIGTVATLLALAVLVAFKLLVTVRLTHDLTGEHAISMAKTIAWTNVWYYGLAAPRTLAHAARASAPWALAVASVLAIASGWYLHRIAAADPGEERSLARAGLGCVLVGVVVVPLGEAIVLTGSDVAFGPTGRANRVAIAGAIGVALVIVGAVAAVTARMAPRLRRRWFAGLIAATAAGAFVVEAYIISWWSASYRMQREILATLRAAFPTLPPHTAIILDAACHNPGDGLVFHSPADLRGALDLQYGDSTLRADVVVPTLAVRGDGLHTFKWGGEYRYPYDRLIAFNLPSRTAHRIADSAAASAYFARYNPGRQAGPCPSRPSGAARELIRGTPDRAAALHETPTLLHDAESP
jgi:hypothetical protein